MLRTVILGMAILFLSGCGDGISTASTSDKPGAFVVFDSDSGTIAYPNNILFAGSTDGTLNIPYEATDADAGIKAQLNTLDGFSTTSPATLPLSGPVDAATLPGNVRLFKVTAVASAQTLGIPAVVATEKEMKYGQDFVASVSGDRIAIVPLQPLESHSNYMVIVTDGVRAANGGKLSPDAATAMLNGSQPLVDAQGNPTVYLNPDAVSNTQTATQLEGLRQLTQMMFAQAEGAGIEKDQIVTAWSFQTQTIGKVQENIAAEAQAHTGSTLVLLNTNATTLDVLGAGYGTAQIYAGVLTNVPQYMPQPENANDTTPITSGEFSYSAPFTPIVEANVTLPVVATVPNTTSGCTEPGNGWPVVIYQHGITRARTDLFVFGETLAKQCYAGVAIDLPLHGVTESNLSKNPFYQGELERTYNADLVTENPYGKVVAYVPDGVIDSTGINFMNLAHMVTTRDNLQQTTSDLTVLTRAIGTAVGVKLNGSRIAFLSHSLGNIASIGYLNRTDALTSAVLMMPGQQLIPFLLASSVFGPEINAGLAAYGLYPGTPEYDAFTLSAQTLVDDADPANYTADLGTRDALPILEMQAVNDEHIPALIATAPLSGSNPFIAFTGAEDLNTSALVNIGSGYLYVPDTNKTVSRITAGDYRSPLDPQYSPEATAEYHTEMISFIDSNGTAVLVNTPSIIQQ